MTDEPQVAQLPLVEQFDELVRIDGHEQFATAESVEATRLGRFFSAAAEAIQSAEAPSLIWLHSQGLAGPWDAPLQLRNFYAAEDDPEPPAIVDPPNLPIDLFRWISLRDHLGGSVIESFCLQPFKGFHSRPT